MLTAEGRLEEAYEVSSATNNMPEICGRICPQDRLCEGNCVIEQAGHGTVTIGSVEKYITDTASSAAGCGRCRRSPSAGRPSASSAAGRPASRRRRSCAAHGYQVHVYDRHDRIGGLLVYGIPNFKLEKHVVGRRVDLLERGGVVFHSGFEVGRDMSFAELRGRHDAILIANRRLQGPRHPGAGFGSCQHRAGARFPDRVEPQGPRGQRAGLRRRPAQCRRPEDRRHRRRRHGDGLRAHRGAPGGALREVPLPPRPRQHAGFAPPRFSMPRRRASSSPGCGARGVPGRRPGACGARAADPPGRARLLGPPDARADSGLELRRGRRSRHQGARVRTPRDLPRLFDEPELGVTRLGHGRGRLQDDGDEPRRRVRRRRHRARRVARGSGRSATGARRPRRSMPISRRRTAAAATAEAA